MGIDHGASDAARNVRCDHVAHERTFPGAGCPEDGHVFAPGFGWDHELALLKERTWVVLNSDGDGFERHGVNDNPQGSFYSCGKMWKRVRSESGFGIRKYF